MKKSTIIIVVIIVIVVVVAGVLFLNKDKFSGDKSGAAGASDEVQNNGLVLEDTATVHVDIDE